MSTTAAPPPSTPPPKAVTTTQVYCARCGRVDDYIDAVLSNAKQPPNCPTCHRVMKTMDQAASDPDLGR